MSADDLISRINRENEQAAYQAALDIALPALKDGENDYALWIAAGNAYYGLKQFESAERAYLKAADLCSQDVIALSNLAGVYFETGRFADGLTVCDRALRRRPDYLNVHIHRGNMLSSLDRYDEAVAAYQTALETAPEDPLVLFNLAYALVMTGQYDKAAEIYRRLLTLTPNDPEYLFAYAAFLEKTEDFETAAEIYLKLLQIEETPTTHITLGGCLYNLLLLDKTDAVWRLTDTWLTLFPDNPVALHTLETLKNSREVTRASAEYVRELFDAFADSFDSVLAGLSYQAPDLVASAVKKQSFSTVPSILDLGCGTGLCAAALQKEQAVFHSLTGVDLSAAMLEKANQRGIYTELVQSDILSFLPSVKKRFDLIVSADVFTYLGDLSELFAGISAALKQGGRVIFTVSENTADTDGYALEPSGRFVHGRDYILRELKKSGLTVLNISGVELRQELGKPVYGLLVIGIKT